MMMSESEIRSSYRTAKDPKKQVRILADLNDVTPKAILAIINGTSVEKLRRSGGYQKVAVDRRRKYSVITDTEIETIKNMWNVGASIKRIAEAVGRRHCEINRFAESHRDICPKRRIIVEEAERLEALRRYNAGESIGYIAKMMGFEYYRAHYIISRHKNPEEGGVSA